ncbi:glycosyltransferase [Candidatus Moduliflexus flocculans]|uniref:Glycosyltransferase n=1 Tax=Candidatus Moduliflexus flocculans TaxID=1499966 RepID=A0A081BP04_9BACT|nr:glycosyltransferase [Candidatus Moduliflexus flocculans]
MKIHQLLPCLRHGDAIGNHTLEIQRILRQWGYDSEIYADDIHADMRAFAKSYMKLRGSALRDAILLYHFSVGSPVSEFVKSVPNKKLLIYHNITPGHFFKGYEDYIRQVLDNGREELHHFVNLCDLAVGDSEYNRIELEEAGFPRTGVLPIILDFDKYSRSPDALVLQRFDDDWANLMFVGRLAPNKCQEDIIHAFYVYKQYVNPKSRLFLVGLGGIERYDFMLQEFIKKLGVKDVYLTGKVSDDELAAYYQIADLLLCMSEHEGFNVPMVEAMHAGVPVLAYNSTSIPYTLGESGVLINDKRYDEIAEMIDLLVTNQTLREAVIAAQRKRLDYFDRARLEQTLKSYIAELTTTN